MPTGSIDFRQATLQRKKNRRKIEAALPAHRRHVKTDITKTETDNMHKKIFDKGGSIFNRVDVYNDVAG